MSGLAVLLLAGSLKAASTGSVVRAEVVEVSPGWSCAALEAELRSFERRVRVTFLGKQWPQDVYSRSADKALRLPLPSERVPDDVQLAAWQAWKAPVTVELLLQPRRTEPQETTLTEPHGYRKIEVALSSGTSHVDSSAVSSVISGSFLRDCRRNFWRVRITLSPPALPVDVRLGELRRALQDPDAWVRVLGANELLRLHVSVDAARSVLEAALHDDDERLREVAAAFLKEASR